VVKHLSGDDWLARASLDETGRAVGLWEDGVYDLAAPFVDSAVVAAARPDDGKPYPAALLMRDVTPHLVPEDAAVDLPTHTAFVEAMAALHVAFWQLPPETTLMPLRINYEFLSPRQARREAAGVDSSDVLRFVEPGWRAVFDQRPDVAARLRGLLDDPGPLVGLLESVPATFLHGDWKMGNLGRRDDGMVVLLDWDRVSTGPGLVDLGWYLAVNSDRLPEAKDDTCTRYREALERGGVTTADWWQPALDAALLGAFLQLGWSKAGQDDELDWWCRRVAATAL
jgi:hypothetical protein